MCEMHLIAEFTADVVAADIVMKALAQEGKQISIDNLAELFCPSDKTRMRETFADGSSTTTVDWYDRSSSHLSFSERHSILYSTARKYGLSLDNQAQPKYNYPSCF